MNNLGDYLEKKSEQLDLGRQEDLAAIQATLDAWYPGKAKAKSFKDGRLLITAQSASVAGELRFKTTYLQNKHTYIKKVVIAVL